MERLIRTLIELLVEKGMELTSIPAFIRNLAHTLAADPDLTIEELNGKIHQLGWDDFDLDYYTLQLVLATFEPGNPSIETPGEDDLTSIVTMAGFPDGKVHAPYPYPGDHILRSRIMSASKSRL